MSEPAGLLGRQLGSYRMLSHLGAGGMGEVYRAYDSRLQRAVALKLLRTTEAHEDAAGTRLLREARAAAALNHPNICTVYDVGEIEGHAYIAMELVEGEPLNRVIPAGTGLPADRVLDYGRQIADALSHAHEHGVLHRDLKPPNIVITKTGRPKILDFGIAKRIATGGAATTEVTTAQTVPGTLVGTPAYMAPEQLRGESADARTDVWAFGVVLHEMAGGGRPFGGQTPYDMSSAILHEPARPLPDSVPGALRSVVARCLEKNPADRFQSAAEAAAALDAVRDGQSPAVAPAKRARRLLTGRGVVRTAAVLALLLVVAAAAAGSGRLRDWLWARPPLYDSIAVLPFENLSEGAEHEFLADGIQQALITELAQLRGFRKVTPAASARRVAADQTLADAGSALGVRALVTGSVARVGDRVQVAVQLIEAATERQVWGDSYDREADDLIGLQNDVVAAIAGAVELRLRPEDRTRIAARATIRPATYELYLRGMHLLGEDRGEGNVRAALDLLQQAIDDDPGDPYAYVGLARGYAVLGHGPMATADAWHRARAAAERALTLAPEMAEAHAVMGDVKLYFEWDWEGAERAFQRTNELNPNLAMNHYRYAWYLFLVDRLDEAIGEHERARDLDPMTPLHTTWLADLYRAAGRYDEAIATARASLDVNPGAAQAWSVLSHTYSDMGRHDDAVAAARRAVEIAPPQTFALGVAYARADRMDEARAIRPTIEARPPTPYSMWARAMLYLHLGDADAFFDAIAYEPHHAFVPWVRTDPALDRFRDDPRYAQLMARFKLPPPRSDQPSRAPGTR